MSELDELFKVRSKFLASAVENSKDELAEIIKRKVEELRPVYKSPIDMQKDFGLPLHDFQKEILRKLTDPSLEFKHQGTIRGGGKCSVPAIKNLPKETK